MRSVLVTRPQPVADEFAEQLRREGFCAYVAPMMEYVEVGADLSDLEGYQALVFTSVQAVQIFSRRSQERRFPVLAVGDTTAEAASRAGFTDVHSARGDSDDVIGLIRDKAAPLALKRILHLCSDDTPQHIGKAVSRLGVKVVQRRLYKAKPTDRFPDDVLQALRQNTIDTVTLFSARTAANIVHLMRHKDLRGISAKLEVVCLSERVAAELKEIPWRVVRIASRPDMESMLEILKTRGSALQKDMPPANRRERTERRQKISVRDDGGNINEPSYAGPERRTGIGRRAYEKRQQELVMQERMKFFSHSVLAFAFLFIAVVLAGVLLMGPEYVRFGESAGSAGRPEKNTAPQTGRNSFEGALNSKIEKMQNSPVSLTEAAGRIVSSAQEDLAGNVFQGFSQMLGRVDYLRHTSEGDAAVGQSLRELRMLLAESPDNPEAINRAVQKARRHDKVLNSLLGQIGLKDFAAAALLLTLSEFRSNVDNHRPYAEDLALLQQFAGSDPEMNLALQRLSPYAEKGIMGREALEAEFNGFANDIVMATVQGRDISVKERALKRFHSLSRLFRIDDMKGQSPEAVVARARLLLHKGDVKGAVHELQALDGASAQAAEPWMDNAAEYVAADQSSDILTRGILQDMSGESGLSIDNIISAIKENMRRPDVSYLSPALKKGDGNYGGVLAPSSP